MYVYTIINTHLNVYIQNYNHKYTNKCMYTQIEFYV